LTFRTIERSRGLRGLALGVAAAALLALGMPPGTANAAHPRLGVVSDCAFLSSIVDGYERGGVVFRKHGRYRYGAKVEHKRLAGKIRHGRYKVKGNYFDQRAIKFLTSPKILRPKREDGAKSFFDPAKPTYVGIYAADAIDLPWDCYQVGSKDWREREKQQREDS
jgi:hypothetical protein